MDKISGIYKITNTITSDFYIGSSKNIKQRWYGHKCLSVWKKHPNVKLYKAMTQYGRDNFTIEVIEETDNLREREQYWIGQLKPTYNDRHADGYNIERKKEVHKRCNKEWNKSHREEQLKKMKSYRQAHRAEHSAKNKVYYSRLCLYEGETLTLHALTNRFFRQGIAHPCKEAMNYLL